MPSRRVTEPGHGHGGHRHGGPPIHELAVAPDVVLVRVDTATVAFVPATMELLELSPAAATLVAALRDGRPHRVSRPGTLARQLLDLGVLQLNEVNDDARSPMSVPGADGRRG